MANAGNYFLGLSNHLAGYDPGDDGSSTPPPTPSPGSDLPPQFPATKEEAEDVAVQSTAKENVKPICEKCFAKFSNKFNRDRHGKTCGKKSGEGEKENRKMVEIKKSGVKCVMSDEPVAGTLVIPCSVYFKN